MSGAALWDLVLTGVLRGGFYALMADGSVRYIPKNTDEKIVRAMITRAGNETFQLPGQQQ